MSKKYYWLKLQNDFFKQPRIKKLRKIAGGDTYTIIYLELQLLSLSNNGVLVFEGIEDDFIEELALTLDEDADNVRLTVSYLIKHGLIEEVKEDEYALVETMKNIGSETDVAKRVREHREKTKLLQCNTDVTNCNIEIDIDKEIDNSKKKTSKKFVVPTLEEVTDYCRERNNSIDPQHFIDYYTSNGWMVGKNKMKDWKATVRTWEKNSKPTKEKVVYDSYQYL